MMARMIAHDSRLAQQLCFPLYAGGGIRTRTRLPSPDFESCNLHANLSWCVLESGLFARFLTFSKSSLSYCVPACTSPVAVRLQ